MPTSIKNHIATMVESYENNSSYKQEVFFLLENHNYDLDTAISTFFDNNSTIAVNQNDSATNTILPSFSSL